ncbi:hypothetical protein D3C84_665450 [compost metagenome]
MAFEGFADHRSSDIEAQLVALHHGDHIEHLVPFGVGGHHLGRVVTPGVAGDHDLVVNHHPRYRRDVVFAALEADAQLGGDLAALWLRYRQLAADLDARGLHQLLLEDAHPQTRAGLLVSRVDGGGIEVAAPLTGLGIQFGQVGNRLEPQAGLELALDDVPGVLYLASDAGSTRCVNDDLDPQ